MTEDERLEAEAGIRLFRLELPSAVAGVFIWGDEIGACVAVNRLHPPERRLWSLLHETGHFLGLFHTTEQEGADFDPLTDTPKCPCTACSSPIDRPHCGSTAVGAPFIAADRCVSLPSCGGGDNLMFWFLEAGISQGLLTPQQGQVMRLNPLIQ